MKICFFAEHLNGTDGWSRETVDYIKTLHNLGHKIYCFVNKRANINICKEIEILAPSLSYLSNPILPIFNAIKINKYLSQIKPDIIHTIIEPYATIFPYLKIKIPKIITINGSYSIIPLIKKASFFHFLTAYILCNKIISISKYTAKYFKKTFPIISKIIQFKKKLNILQPGIIIDEQFYFNRKNKLRNIKNKFIFVGELKRRKGVLECLKALEIYKKKYNSDFIFNIVGKYNENDNYYKLLKEFIKKSDIKENIVFHGRVSKKKLKELYNNSSLFIMLSQQVGHYFEGYGIVFIEASRRGVPVIGPINSGCSDAIKNNFSGFCCDPFNYEEIALKIHEINDKNKIKIENCYKWAQHRSSLKQTKKLIEIYENIIRS